MDEQLHSTRDELEELRETIKFHEQLIHTLSVPIIPSIIPDTILVPLTGALYEERFKVIQDKILSTVQKDQVDSVVIDFTGISIGSVSNLGLHNLVHEIDQLRLSLRLMGVQTIFTGFSSGFVQELVKSNSDTSHFIVHSTFRAGLAHLMEVKELELIAK